MNKKILISWCLVIVGILALFWLQRDARVPPIDSRDSEVTCSGSDINDLKRQALKLEADLSKYTAITRDIFGKSAEGGQQTDYTHDGEKKLVDQIFYGEGGKSELRYYVQDGRALFFTKKNVQYILPLSEDPRGETKVVEVNEFYLDANQDLCAWFSNGVLQSNTQAAQDTVSYLVSDL